MPHTNASFSALSRTTRLERQIHKLESFSQEGTLNETSETLTAFDVETEQLLIDLYGPDDARLETYKYAALGEAEAIVNLPESAQLEPDRDDFKKSLQQRRQLLLGCIAELREAESTEAEALTGEDREDPPALG
jgi:hypothetical protein